MQKDISKLKSNKKRITNVRKEILNCLSDQLHEHSMKDLITHLKTKLPKVNVASVYNTINLLLAEGLIDSRFSYSNKTMMYELITNSKPHIHFFNINKQQETVYELPSEIFDEINKFAQKNNLKIRSVQISSLVEDN